MNSDSSDELSNRLSALQFVIDSWIELGPNFSVDADPFEKKVEVLERIVELARLQTGKISNQLEIKTLLEAGIAVKDSSTFIVGAARSVPSVLDADGWPAPNERIPSELQGPLLLHLLSEYRRPRRIHETIEDFVSHIKPFLAPRDVESTRTGVARIATNVRLAARTLRKWHMLQNSSRVRYKSWELSHLGLLTAAVLLLRGEEPIGTRGLEMSNSEYLGDEVMAAVSALTRGDTLRRALLAITRTNSEVLGSLKRIREMLHEEHSILADPPSGPEDLTMQKAAAERVLNRIADEIEVIDIADDFAADIALKRLLGLA